MAAMQNKTGPALARSLWFKPSTWQEKALTTSMHGQMLSSSAKRRGFLILGIRD